MKSLYNTIWNRQLFYDQRKQQNAGNKLRTYRTFKTNIKYKYFTKNIRKFNVNSEFHHTI